LDQEIHLREAKRDRETKVQIVRQRITLLCIIGHGFTELEINEFVSLFDFVFSVFFPIVISTDNAKVYYCEIPKTLRAAKGKALADLQGLLSSIFIT
jgi:hypothetical protein